MAGVRIQLGAGGRPGLGCAAGTAVVRLCGCDTPLCACCGTGNQCVLWDQIDDDASSGVSPDVAAHIAATPYLDRLNGWTLLGDGWDVVTDYLDEETEEYWYEDPDTAEISRQTRVTRLAFSDHLVRFRLAPADATPAQIEALWGAATGPDGWQPYPSIAAAKYTDDGMGGYTSAPCVIAWVDVGLYTGERRQTDSADPGSDLVITVTDGVADDFFPGAYPTNAIIGDAPPARTQEWVLDPFVPTYISPIPCDGIVWSGFAETPHAPPVRAARVVGDAFAWEAATDAGAKERIDYLRIGNAGSAVGSAPGFPSSSRVHSCAHAVRHGDDCETDLVESWDTTAPTLPDLAASARRRVRHRLTRQSPCAAYAELPANECTPPAWTNRVGRRCDDPAQKVVFDPATRPDPSYLTFTFGGHRWYPTDQPSPLAAETVVWETTPCHATADFAEATRCRTLPDALFPPTIVYPVDPGIGLGNGSVTVLFSYENPDCPDADPPRFCTALIRYTPTATPHAGPATAGAEHLGGTPCALPDEITCIACPAEPFPGESGGGGGSEARSAPGPDPMAAQMRHFGGGCCG